MNLKQYYLTQNECYKAAQRHTVRGIMVHSTGANNPTLRRYIGPDDGLLGKNTGGNHWNRLRPDGQQICVHAFIGKLADGSIATYQTLPWDYVGWHSGTGFRGYINNANNTGYIGFEICEDGLADPAYFQTVYTEAAELCAMLCKEYGLDPAKDIICHSEGYKMGIASNHGDVMHWFPKHGKSMDTFRADVAELLQSKTLYGVVGQRSAHATREAAERYAAELNNRGEGGWYWKVMAVEGTSLFGVMGQQIALSDRSKAEAYAAAQNAEEKAKPADQRWFWKVVTVTQ